MRSTGASALHLGRVIRTSAVPLSRHCHARIAIRWVSRRPMAARYVSVYWVGSTCTDRHLPNASGVIARCCASPWAACAAVGRLTPNRLTHAWQARWPGPIGACSPTPPTGNSKTGSATTRTTRTSMTFAHPHSGCSTCSSAWILCAATCMNGPGPIRSARTSGTWPSAPSSTPGGGCRP